MKISVTAAFLLIFLNGCAGTPISERAPRDYDGFSIMPPQERGWLVNAAGDRRVAFQKKSASDTHTMFVGVERAIAPKAFLSREEFLRYVNDSFFIVDPNSYEFVVKGAGLNPKHGEFCVEYRYQYKDFRSPRPKSTSFLLHEGHCFVCLHPKAKDREYNVCSSEIFAPGEEDSHFRAAGDAFIDSIQFTDPAGAKQGAKKDLFSVSAELVLDNRNRAFFLSQFGYNPLFPIRMKLDGERLPSLYGGEVATARLQQGQHTIQCSFSLTGAEKSFEMVQDGAKYFLIREYPPEPKLTWGKVGPEILEVSEADWRSIATDPFRRAYHGQ